MSRIISAGGKAAKTRRVARDRGTHANVVTSRTGGADYSRRNVDSAEAGYLIPIVTVVEVAVLVGDGSKTKISCPSILGERQLRVNKPRGVPRRDRAAPGSEAP
jgi:hypothetical protein